MTPSKLLTGEINENKFNQYFCFSKFEKSHKSIYLSVWDLFWLERPFSSDDDIWEALERTNVRQYIHNMKDKLDTKFNILLGMKREKLISLESARVLFSKAQTVIFDFTQFLSDVELLNMIIWETWKQFKTVVILTPWLTNLESVEKVISLKNG